MAEVQLKARLRGQAVPDGSISLRLFLSFGGDFQKTLDRIAYALERQRGSNRSQDAIREETALRVTGTQEGSFEVLMEPDTRRQLSFEDLSRNNVNDLFVEAADRFVDGLNEIRTSSQMPQGYDQGVLVLLKDLGAIFRSGIDAIDLTLEADPITRFASYDKPLLAKVVTLITPPEERLQALIGELLMANFKGDRQDRFKCHLYVNEDQKISCTFDEEIADDIQIAMRHYVHVIGVATIDPVTEDIKLFNIKRVTILDGDQVPTQQELEAQLVEYSTENDAASNFRKGWRQAMSGQVRPLADILRELEDE